METIGRNMQQSCRLSGNNVKLIINESQHMSQTYSIIKSRWFRIRTFDDHRNLTFLHCFSLHLLRVMDTYMAD